MNFDQKLNLALIVEFDLKAPNVDPNAYSRILMMLAEIRQHWIQTTSQEEKDVLGKKAIGIVNTAITDGILDATKAISWLRNSMPGIEIILEKPYQS
jgi:hypothetical protein